MPGPTSSVTVPLFRIMIDGPGDRPRRGGRRPPDQDHRLAAAARRLHARRSATRRRTEGKPFQALDDSKFEVGAKLEVKLGSTERAATKTIFKGEIVTVEPDFQAGGVSMVGARLRQVAPHDARAQAAHVPEQDGVGHRHADRPGIRLQRSRPAPAAARSTRSFSTTSPTGTSSGAWRGGSASSSPSTDESAAKFGAARARRRGRARLPRRPAHLPPAHHLGPAGGEGQRPRLRPQEQEGGREHQDQPAAADRGRHHAQGHREEVPRRHARDLRAVVLLRRRGRRASPSRCSTSSRTPTSPPRAAAHGNPNIKAGAKLKITGVGEGVLRHLPGRQGDAPAAARPAATRPSSPTRPASTRCSAS